MAPAAAALEFPVSGDLRAEIGLLALGQGTYQDKNPFLYLSLVTPWVYAHYDGVTNLRLTAGFQELFYRSIPALGVTAWHEQRLMARARLQQPRGEAALYEMLQLDVRSFVDPTGVSRLVWQPRVRLGQGFNLDAVRIHSLAFYQELGLRFSEASYTTHPFGFFRTVAGYTWTTRRGTYVTLGFLGQVALNPPATRYDILFGPVLVVNYRIRSAPTEAPPEAPEVVNQ